MKPIAFKVRGGGNYSGTKGGAVKPNEKGGAGYLGYEDKTFTISTAPDQWILAPITQPQPIPMNEPAQPAPVGKPLRYLSVCSGMEAASVAWHPLGFKPIAFSEIEPFPSAILKHHFTQPNYPYDVPNLGSLTEYKQWPIEPGAIDLLVGGTPCQSFSVAGLRKGLDDPRGNLALVFLGLADKLKPRWIVWENVPGVLSSNGGRDLGSFLGALVQLGYGFAMRVLDAQHFGVPQRRRRVFVVACLGDWRAPAEVLLESDCVRRDIKKGRAKGQGVASGSEGGVDANGLQRTVGTLCADTHPGAYSGQDAYTGRLIPSHWEGGDIHPTLNQAHNIGSPGYSNQELFSQKGAGLVPAYPIPIQDGREMEKKQNGMGIAQEGDPAYTIDTTGAQSVAIPYRKSKRACSKTDNETWVEADASNTLNNFELGDTRTTHAVVEPFAWTQNQREEVRILGDKTGALALPGTHQSNYIAEHIAHCSDVAPTVTSSGPPYSRTGNERVEAEALAVTFQPVTQSDVAGPLDAHYYKGPGSRQGGEREYVAHPPAMAVRRLTPVECERLQGFPDNWSRISWKGKPEEQCPDGPRYKACGNSMAVPVMSWIGSRIAAADAKHFPPTP